MAEASIFLHDHELDKEKTSLIHSKRDNRPPCYKQNIQKAQKRFRTQTLVFVMAEDEDFREWPKHIQQIQYRQKGAYMADGDTRGLHSLRDHRRTALITNEITASKLSAY